ncbi:hypothetical protein BH10BAC2_BH10BAC2_30680 [soil metagenome]
MPKNILADELTVISFSGLYQTGMLRKEWNVQGSDTTKAES